MSEKTEKPLDWRVSRRELLAGAVTVGAGAAGMALVGCNGDEEESADGGSQQQATPQMTLEPRSGPPKNAIVVLLDSLNRHMLGCYGGTEFKTPNIDRFAQRAVRFDSHYTGSLPCMPARHDFLCGSLDFLWKPWGSVEMWDNTLPFYLRDAKVTSMLISDHPHLFETGGENYHTDFTAWQYERGHESDPWQTHADPSWIGEPSIGLGREHDTYDNSRSYFRGEADYPGPRTMTAAVNWLDKSAVHHDRFFLFIDEFDPHEPFDTPEPYASMYDDTWEGQPLIWPPYVDGGIAQGKLTERQGQQVRAAYGGKLTMIDAWFGKLLDAIERNGLWGDTAVILCTDHGHYLGEKDIWGKPGVPGYEQMTHAPLLVAWPGIEPGTCSALTTACDIFSTLADFFGAKVTQRVHGRSIIPLLKGEATSIRDYALTGVWGRQLNIISDGWKYARGPASANGPISLWSNRWSTMPVRGIGGLRLPLPDSRVFIDHMPGTTAPVLRQPYAAGEALPYLAFGAFSGNCLFNLKEDPNEDNNLIGSPKEAEMADRLRQALRELEAPDEQLVRLGLV